MLGVRAVIGAVCTGFAGLAAGFGAGLAGLPAATPPVATAKAGLADMANNVRLHSNALRVRTCNTTSFVGLRG
jgi:hypothetical protein